MIREKFHWNYTPNKEYFDKLWNDCTFIFDTNVLINLYKYNNKSTHEILRILARIKNRIWMPYQIGMEFSKNLEESLRNEIKISKGILEDVTKLANKLYSNYGYKLEWNEFEKSERNKIKHYEKLIDKDTLINKIEEIIGLDISNSLNSNELDKIYKDGEIRFKKKIPPGFGDKKDKPEPDCYGDLVIWMEILKYSKAEHKDIIFVTEDHSKNDWFEKKDGDTIGPHRGLREEFSRETNNQKFWAYRSKPFFDELESFFNTKIDKNIKDEISHVDNRSFMVNNDIENLPLSINSVINSKNESACLADIGSSLTKALNVAQLSQFAPLIGYSKAMQLFQNDSINKIIEMGQLAQNDSINKIIEMGQLAQNDSINKILKMELLASLNNNTSLPDDTNSDKKKNPDSDDNTDKEQ